MSGPSLHVLAGHARAAARSRPRAAEAALALAVPVALYAVALAIRAWVIAVVDFPANEGSAYYAAVAANLVDGRGLTIDALWSYATPPLVLPRPAFELWQPLASFVAAGPMLILGTSFDAAQVGGALLGALLAPLAWLVTLEAATAIGIVRPAHRQLLAAGSGLLVAVNGPLLAAAALPDSTVPFAVAAVVAALLLARALAAGDASVGRPALLLGVALGFAWLARHEAIWLGLAGLGLAAAAGRLNRRLLVPLVVGGLLVATPWLARNLVTFGTPLPSQTIDNALLVANEQIYAYSTRPTLAAFLGQGVPTLIGNIVAAGIHNLASVLVVPAAPAVVGGLVALPWLVRRRTLRATALGALLVAGGLIFVVATIVFPVASLWGTFEHAAGPLLVGLAVAAVVGGDALVAGVGRRRGWQRNNTWLAPAALVALSLPISGLMLAGLAVEAERQAARTGQLAAAVLAQPEAVGSAVLISDHPIWLAQATGLPAIALPAEPLASIVELARRFDAPLIAITAPRGAYPALLRSAEAQACFVERAPDVFAVREECRR